MSDTKSNEAPQPQPSKTEWWRAAIPLAVLLILWFCPLPDGLSAKGMHMFAIFAATIVSILTAPLPTGAIMFIALTVAYFTGTLTLKEDLAGFSSGTVWLIFSAYILSLGFVKSGLGKRIAPCVAAFLILPWFTKLLIRPTMNHTPEVKVHGKEMLAELGPLSTQEKKVAVGFILALLGWGTAILTGFNANAIGIAVVAYLMVTKALEWKDALAEKAAWDTVVWFGVFISLATGLSKLGFIKWFTGVVSAQLAGSAWIAAFLLLLVIYVYTHYLFATVAAHVIAMYVPFAAVAIACGAPVGLVAIAFCIFSNPMWGLTEYGSGPGPLYFGQGYFERPRFYALNFAVITMDVVVMLAVGIAWWKVIGLY